MPVLEKKKGLKSLCSVSTLRTWGGKQVKSKINIKTEKREEQKSTKLKNNREDFKKQTLYLQQDHMDQEINERRYKLLLSGMRGVTQL